MELEAEGERKYGSHDVLASSRALPWRGLAAELRRHPAGELPPFQPTHLEIGIAVACHAECVVTRRSDGLWQRAQVEPGIVWLCPSGASEEDIQISHWHDVLHLYLSAERFAQHAEIQGGAEVHPESVRYLGGFSDETLRMAGASLLAEIRAPTSTGRLLADGVSLAVTARIIERYVGGVRRGVWARPRHVLAEHRLRRVLQFMVEHLEDDFGLDELAAVAGLSVFHFHRMFANAMGVPPHRYLGQMRLERAKTLLALGRLSLAEISFACRFSSQPNFSRAFRRATGMTPLAYRNEAGR
jgi:AraC family transcriptional regulator